MTNEKLLIPRYEVIADYPNSDFKVGSILTNNGLINGWWYDGKTYTTGVDKYPHLFKPLQWWEKRNVEDLPEYVYDKSYKQIFKIERWEYNVDNVITYAKVKTGYLSCMSDLILLTEQKYLEYINSKK
jgi:hypothetical protein